MSEHAEHTEPTEHALVMPFIVCKSNGGTLDDDAFVIGMELGKVYAELHYLQQGPSGHRSLPGTRVVHTEGLAQLDLIAMKFGYTIHREEVEGFPQWTSVTFKEQD